MRDIIKTTVETTHREVQLVVDVDPHTGRHRAHYDGATIASEDDGDIVHSFLHCKEIRAAGIHRGTIAHIGMGFAVTAWMLGPDFEHTFYELHPLGPQYRPPFVSDFDVIVGDWHVMIDGAYDVIVCDFTGTPTREDVSLLRTHLNPGGLLVGHL